MRSRTPRCTRPMAPGDVLGFTCGCRDPRSQRCTSLALARIVLGFSGVKHTPIPALSLSLIVMACATPVAETADPFDPEDPTSDDTLGDDSLPRAAIANPLASAA